MVRLDVDNLQPSEYSQLLMKQGFWGAFAGEKILLYQEDTMLFHGRIDPFLRYDYIGAPWPANQDDNAHGVGNGGFSLRSKSKMISCIDTVDVARLKLGASTIDYIKNTGSTFVPEDVFFSKSMIDYKMGKVARRHIATEFSQETQKARDPCGGHCFWIADGNRFTRPYVNTYVLGTSYTRCSGGDHRSGWAAAIRNAERKGIVRPMSSPLPGTLLIDCMEHHFLFGGNSGEVRVPWIGVVHFPPVSLHGQQGLDDVLAAAGPSLRHCRGLITLSDDLRKQVAARLPAMQVDSIKHPIEALPAKFSIAGFRHQTSYAVVQVGNQFRQVSAIYRLNTKLPKLWVGARQPHLVAKELGLKRVPRGIVRRLGRLSDNDYDQLLLTNVVIIPLWCAAANNSILECIEMNVPAFVTRLPATEEYLGKDYPLFYSRIGEIEAIINNRETLCDRLEGATDYLSRMDKTDIRYERFNSDLLRIINR